MGRRPPSREGKIPWNKGMKGKQVAWNKGIPMSLNTKEKLQVSLREFYSRHPEEKIANGLRIKKKWQNQEYRRKCEEAQKGAKSYRWEGGKTMLPYGTEFTKDRKAFIRARDNFTCQGCGQKEKEDDKENLSIHHINYDKKDCSIGNLITTCRSCNSKANFDKPKWIAFYKSKFTVATN